jgi:hypothetical protein
MNIKVGDKIRWIYLEHRKDLTMNNVYTVNRVENNEIWFRDDGEWERFVYDYQFPNCFELVNKYYPNTSLFRKLYPEGKEQGKFIEVTRE